MVKDAGWGAFGIFGSGERSMADSGFERQGIEVDSEAEFRTDDETARII